MFKRLPTWTELEAVHRHVPAQLLKELPIDWRQTAHAEEVQPLRQDGRRRHQPAPAVGIEPGPVWRLARAEPVPQPGLPLVRILACFPAQEQLASSFRLLPISKSF